MESTARHQPRCICTTLRSAALEATKLYDDALADVGVSVTMYRLLKHIDDLETPTITNLGQSMGLDRSTMGRNVRVLEKQGLAELTGGKDGRTAIAQLTVLGAGKLVEAKQAWVEAQATMSALLGEDLDTVLTALNRISPRSDDQTDHQSMKESRARACR